MKTKTFEPVAAGCRGFAATSKNRQTASRQVVLKFPRKLFFWGSHGQFDFWQFLLEQAQWRTYRKEASSKKIISHFHENVIVFSLALL
jgi:hypothetical protein